MKYTAVVTYHEINDFGVRLEHPYWHAQIPYAEYEYAAKYASASAQGKTPAEAVEKLRVQMRFIDMVNAPKQQVLVEFEHE